MSFFKAKSQSIPSETFAALDIGSSKVCCAIAKMNREITPEKGITVKILGVASHAAKGIRGASIINLDDLEDSILNGIHTAEQLAKQTIHNVYVICPQNPCSPILFPQKFLCMDKLLENLICNVR